jgi:hypothetical protein
MAVVLKTVTSRSFGKTSLPGARHRLVNLQRREPKLRDQLSVIFGALIIK